MLFYMLDYKNENEQSHCMNISYGPTKYELEYIVCD